MAYGYAVLNYLVIANNYVMTLNLYVIRTIIIM